MSQVLHHKKHEHRESVKRCKNTNCRFGVKNCWFLHEEEKFLEEPKNQGITEKIFNMMETFTNRIVNLENQTKNDK